MRLQISEFGFQIDFGFEIGILGHGRQSEMNLKSELLNLKCP